jgi:hypothetical protein
MTPIKVAAVLISIGAFAPRRDFRAKLPRFLSAFLPRPTFRPDRFQEPRHASSRGSPMTMVTIVFNQAAHGTNAHCVRRSSGPVRLRAGVDARARGRGDRSADSRDSGCRAGVATRPRTPRRCRPRVRSDDSRRRRDFRQRGNDSTGRSSIAKPSFAMPPTALGLVSRTLMTAAIGLSVTSLSGILPSASKNCPKPPGVGRST